MKIKANAKQLQKMIREMAMEEITGDIPGHRYQEYKDEATQFREVFPEEDLVHIRAFVNLETDDMPEHVWDKLYSYFEEDMPYGTQKARTGDPQEWIADHLEYYKDELGL